jgi:DNA-binding transcriptional LysR family regulator
MGKLNQIETFYWVAMYGNFAKAARELGVSTAAVSKQISALEHKLGASLIARSTRRFALTELGAAYFEQCRKIVAQLKEAEAFMAASKGEASGALRVTAGPHFSEHYIVPHLSEFMRLYPKIQLDLELAERMPDLEEEGIDVLIGMSMSGPPNCVQKKIAETKYVLCASPAYIAKHGMPQNPEDLVGHKYITHSMRLPEDVIHFRGGKEIRLDPVLRLNNTMAMFQCAQSDIGIVKLHDYVVTQAIQGGRLVEILGKYMGPALPIYVCYQRAKYVAPKVRRFIDFVLGKLPK